jgi:hypothetical protein
VVVASAVYLYGMTVVSTSTRMPIADRPPTLGEVREAASASAGGHSI